MEVPVVLEEKREYVTVALPPIAQQSSLHIPPSRSLHRRWKQLPRLLRVLVVVAVLLLAASVVLLWSRRYESSTSSAQTQGTTPKADHLQQQLQVGESGTAGAGAGAPTEVQDRHDQHPPPQHRGDVGIPGEHNDLNQIPPPASRGQGRAEAVVAAMKHAWTGYRTYAWGHDHLRPVSKQPHDWLHLGLTLIDALDTLWIMGLKKEFNDGREWIATQLDFNINQEVNLFETTIRVLGGLLSCYHLTNDKLFLDKAIDIADRLLEAFNSESGVPFSDVNLATRYASKPKWGPDSTTSEVTTIQLEFRDLSTATGNPVYAAAVDRVSRHIHGLVKLDGLVPIYINADNGNWRPHATVTLGARGDTYYEYLLKQWLQGGRREAWLVEDYVEAVQGMQIHLMRRTHPSGFLFLGELHGSQRTFVNKMDELTCFLPGTLALGHRYGADVAVVGGWKGTGAASHLTMAQELMHTCVQTWLQQPTRLAPEITFFNTQETSSNEDFFVKISDAHYLLRPETVESLWYLFQVTGNTTYQDWGWTIFQAIERHCRVSHGYTTINNVKNAADVRPRDMMESFFLGETLKYLYMLFSEDQSTYSIDKWVFNTEAHPLPMMPPAVPETRA